MFSFERSWGTIRTMGAIVKLKHTHKIGKKWRWIPPLWMRELRATAETITEGDLLTGAAIDRSRALTEFYEAMRAETTDGQSVTPGSVSWLIKSYEQSTWYAALASRTRENVDRSLMEIESALGLYPAAALDRARCREFYETACNKWSPETGRTMATWLRRLLSWSVEIGLRTENPANGMELKSARPRRMRWHPDEVDAVIAKAIELDEPQVALAVSLGYDTAARIGDLITALWSQYDGEGMTFVQSKTDVEIWVPLSGRSIERLNAIDKRSTHIIASPHTQRPYKTRTAISRTLRRVMKAAGVRDELQFRDLRRTAASEISAGGAQIHSVTGHTPGSNMARVYVVPDKDAARAAQAARKQNKN